MELSDLNRRSFLKHSATAAAVSAGVAGSELQAAALTKAEIRQWTARQGATFRVDDAELQLRSVTASDHSADPARPRHYRTHSVALLFVLQRGSLNPTRHHYLNHDGENLYLSPVVPPKGESGRFFEVVFN